MLSTGPCKALQALGGNLCTLTDTLAQGVLNWVAEPRPGEAPPAMEARLYGTLFRSQSPGDLGDDWLADLNPDSLTIVRGALAGPALAGAQPGDWCAPRLPIICDFAGSRADHVLALQSHHSRGERVEALALGGCMEAKMARVRLAVPHGAGACRNPPAKHGKLCAQCTCSAHATALVASMHSPRVLHPPSRSRALLCAGCDPQP